MRPKSEIYTPRWDDEHPHPFHIGDSPGAAARAGVTQAPRCMTTAQAAAKKTHMTEVRSTLEIPMCVTRSYNLK